MGRQKVQLASSQIRTNRVEARDYVWTLSLPDQNKQGRHKGLCVNTEPATTKHQAFHPTHNSHGDTGPSSLSISLPVVILKQQMGSWWHG